MSSKKKSIDKSANFEHFIEQTSDYLLPLKTKEQSPLESEQNNKHIDKRSTVQTSKRKKRTSIGDLFGEPVVKEKIVNTTLQLPESLNERLKEFCDRYGTSKNKVVITLIEALLEEKGF